MENPFEVLQQQLAQIHAQLSHLILDQSQSVANDDEVIFNIEQAAEFLGVSRSTLHSNKGNLPHYKRFGRLYFFKLELIEYLKSSPQPELPASIRHPRRTRKRKALTD